MEKKLRIWAKPGKKGPGAGKDKHCFEKYSRVYDAIKKNWRSENEKPKEGGRKRKGAL